MIGQNKQGGGNTFNKMLNNTSSLTMSWMLKIALAILFTA
jgi:hypothetical protein